MRSRDARSKPDITATEGPGKDSQPAKRRSHLHIIATCFLILCIAGVLVTLLQWTTADHLVFSFGKTSTPSTDNIHPSRLHPQDHISRRATTIRQKWKVTSGDLRPDGVLKRVYLINDAFPGPTLECRCGDRLIIEVENALDDEGLSFHWHGLSMRGANEMDGAVGITNDPIPVNGSFIYDFRVEDGQSGTFWYHSHNHLQRAEGLYGGLIVHKPKPWWESRDEAAEHLVMLGDWYHRTAGEALKFFSHPGAFGNEAVPDSILVNGHGAYNCSDAVAARPVDCLDYTSDERLALELDSKKRNILRVVNVGSYAGAGISSSHFHFTPIGVDGGNRVEELTAKSMQFLQPGERVDVQIESSGQRTAGPSSLEVFLETAPFKYPNSALTPLHTFAIAGTPPASKAQAQAQDSVDLQALRAAAPHAERLPSQADHTIVLYAITQRLAHLNNQPLGFINSTTWQPQASPPKPLVFLGRPQWDKHQLVPHIPYKPSKPLWIDIVLNNLDEEGHPFHLHGHDFWVLSTYSSTFNWGSYNPYTNTEPPGGKYNLVNPVKKDTVHVPRRGYAVLRLRADNPGIWMFHCHVMWHQAAGMSMAFDISPDK
ncbi:putative laccase [Neohortaea acidophila]|uniref:Putative laccase n=2 Tax=Neohortaea acidophila TaxID=245834 RepID=A0A6A6PSM8_9PEZI|nr:putative laccase [Neohortaea acidophila]KAF2482895.1 putative laccase [Neohortaea acidophila]